ncbi:Transposon Ty3-G Gag-Pol polyprotein [Trichinella murrelli]|uniref:Transposon Ty3-G Gag-Pol polyprotein n=1 Tax=Trichinella murrelli TaxID=144512 RepID=A0A0V0UF98_9BILA|nr:Transposon Ty3-G Gag-Pol polyprotein [Trichinella murrelli]
MGQGRFPSVPAKVGFYALAPLQPVPGCKLFGNTTVQHPVQQSHCRAPLRMKNANSRSQILVAMEQILPKEQETGRKYQPTLTAILEQFSDVLGTRIAYHQRAQVETLLNGMMPRDVIEPSCSPWASPIVLVNKKHGSSRFCDDYRQLKNARNGSQSSIWPTDNGRWKWKRGTDKRLPSPPHIACTSLSRTAEEHTARLQEVHDRLRKAGMKVKPEKCQLMKRKVAYSGHIISEKGIATVPSKTRAVAFDALKHQLTSAPILAYLDFRSRFLVDVNASGDGLGAVLRQKDDSKERVVAYASRSLTKPESRCCVTLREMLGLMLALHEFRPYLYGQRFLVRTDHSCRRWLRNLKEPEGHAARWLESLAELDFEVEHRPGRLHGNAAALSRTSCAQCGRPMKSSMCALRATPSGSAVVAQTLWDQLLAAQQADPEIQLLRLWVTSGPWPTQCPHEYSRDVKMIWHEGLIWIVQEDLICRHRDVLTAEEGVTQVLITRALISEIMRSLHSRRYAGHLECGEKRPSKNSRALMQPMTVGYSLHRLGMDILGPLEKTPSGNRYVLFLTDYFTKWTAAFPLTNMEADTVAKVLMEKYIAYFGAPDCLHSEQGRSFEARVVVELCRLFDIKKTRSSPYHPQGNGQAERFNGTLLDMLSILCEENRQQWDEMLSFAMHSSVNKSIGVTTAIAMFGRQLQLPLDIQMGSR